MLVIVWAPRRVATAKIWNLAGVAPPPLIVSQALEQISGKCEPTLSDTHREGLRSYFFVRN